MQSSQTHEAAMGLHYFVEGTTLFKNALMKTRKPLRTLLSKTCGVYGSEACQESWNWQHEKEAGSLVARS